MLRRTYLLSAGNEKKNIKWLSQVRSIKCLSQVCWEPLRLVFLETVDVPDVWVLAEPVTQRGLATTCTCCQGPFRGWLLVLIPGIYGRASVAWRGSSISAVYPGPSGEGGGVFEYPPHWVFPHGAVADDMPLNSKGVFRPFRTAVLGTPYSWSIAQLFRKFQVCDTKVMVTGFLISKNFG